MPASRDSAITASLIKHALSLPPRKRRKFADGFSHLAQEPLISAVRLLNELKWKTSWRLLLGDKRLGDEAKKALENAGRIRKNEADASISQLKDEIKRKLYWRLGVYAKNEQNEWNIEQIEEKTRETIGMLASLSAVEDKGVMYGPEGNWDEIMALLEAPTNMVRTGIDQFDLVTGGFEEGSLIMILARTGDGKTMLGIQLGRNMAKQGEDSDYYALEMTDKQLNRRIIANASGLATNTLRSAEFLAYGSKDEEARKELMESAGSLLVKTKTGRKNMAGLLATARENANVFIDNLRNLRVSDKSQPWQTLDGYMVELKQWLMETKRIGVVFMHLTKSNDTRFATMLEDHCDYIWKMEKQDSKDIETEEDESLFVVNQQKSRHDGCFPFGLRIKYATAQVEECPEVVDFGKKKDLEKKRQKFIDKHCGKVFTKVKDKVFLQALELFETQEDVAKQMAWKNSKNLSGNVKRDSIAKRLRQIKKAGEKPVESGETGKEPKYKRVKRM